tara:strand:- start:614 stop:1165 length:552 start_codon:yes stop_codon:yes gene_type:complete
MKITKSKLKQIIKEELESILAESGGAFQMQPGRPDSSQITSPEHTYGLNPFLEQKYVAPLKKEGWHRADGIPKNLGLSPGDILETLKGGYKIEVVGVNGSSHKATGRLVFIVEDGVRGRGIPGQFELTQRDFTNVDTLLDLGLKGRDTEEGHEDWRRQGMQSKLGKKPQKQRRNTKVYAVMVK